MTTRPVTIEDAVWLAAEVIVLKGITISCHEVVGVSSVVTKDVVANPVVPGISVRLVGSEKRRRTQG